MYHCDGIRMDAISRALYWQGDPNRGVNQGAVNFLRSLNHGLNERLAHRHLHGGGLHQPF